MRIQPLNQIPKGRSQSAKGSESVKGSLSGLRRLGSSQQADKTQALPQNWQEHEIDATRDRVAISDDARKWQQGEWLDEGIKPGEDPKTTAEEVVRNPEFAKHAQKIHKPRIQLREMAKKGQHGRESEDLDNGLEDSIQGGLSAKGVDPKIAMASRHAPLETMFHRGPQTLNMRGNLSLPGGQNLPLTASFEMSEGNPLQASFQALAS